MIVAFMIYSCAIGAFAAITARLLEVVQAQTGRARRVPWMLAIGATLVLPPLATSRAEPVIGEQPALRFFDASADQKLTPAQRSPAHATTGAAPSALPSLETIALGGWIGWSTVMLAFVAFNALRLARNSRRWQSREVDALTIAVTPDLGPAVYGWWRPRVLVPAWLLAAPGDTARLALIHEREHLVGRDPQVLALVTLLVALLPWNLPLIWMLRRLRFAMEVDCDARVLRAGVDPADYGRALLFVSERQARTPLGSMALIERSSELERRIHIMLEAPRHRALAVVTCLALAASCVFAAAQIDAPARIGAETLKPPPSGPDSKLGPIFEREFQKRWPGLFDEEVRGTTVIIALINTDLTITKFARVTSTEKQDDVGADTAMFRLIGIAPEETAYTAIMGMQSPKHPERVTMVLYTEKKTPGERFFSKVFQDTRAIDREIVRAQFPGATKGGVPSGAALWVLFDRTGRVVRKGIEPSLPAHVDEFIGARFPGVKVQENIWSPLVDEKNLPIRDRGGHDIQLTSMWLAPDSPLPKD